MVRFLTIFLCGMLIVGPQKENTHTKPMALTVELTGEQDVQRLLEEMERIDARITVFLGEGEWDSALMGKFAASGHEVGLHIHSREGGLLLSRRNMAAQIVDARAGLPKTVKPHWLRLEEGTTDGAKQVARVKNLAILGESDGTAREGCVMDLGDASVDEVLLAVKLLRGQGYEMVTVSELARRSRVAVRPGRVYEGFAPTKQERSMPTVLQTATVDLWIRPTNHIKTGDIRRYLLLFWGG